VIISASRRTDIPAFYSEWFYNRLKEGYVLVRNPFNFHQVSKVRLTPEAVDCFVFWTKDPRRMLSGLDRLAAYPYYFQFTLTPYDCNMECGVPQKDLLLRAFQQLSSKIGGKRVIWRYDPIIFSDTYTKEYHYRNFAYLAQRLAGYTEKCVISFLDIYQKTEKNLRGFKLATPSEATLREISAKFFQIAAGCNIQLQSCSEKVDLDDLGIKHGKCIDDELIAVLTGKKITKTKDKNQREACLCLSSIDIGVYHTCPHHCLYCYANANRTITARQRLLHNPRSPLLIGNIEEADQIYER